MLARQTGELAVPNPRVRRPIGGFMAGTIIEPPVRRGREARHPAPGRQPGELAATLPGRRPPRGERMKVPRPSVPVFPRPRVTELIRSAAAHRIALVCGPAGSGKTVACALWAEAARPAGRVAWLTVDPGDRRPERLGADVRAALASAPAVPRELSSWAPRPGGDPFPLPLVAAAEQLGAPVTLVIDNVQELAGSEALASLDLLIRHGPRALRLLLVGRHAGGLQVARLRVDGDLAEVGPADLACTADEADRYFAMLGIDMPPAQRDDLLGRTLGWITGLRLAALHATTGRPAAPVWRVAGDEPAVADYLRDEMLATQPADRRLFLLRTCITDLVTGSLANALTGGTDGTAVLDQLCRENVLIHRVAQRSAEYAYHPLLLDMLRAELNSALPDEVPALAARAARWYAARADPADAIRFAAQAGDWDFASRVLAEAGPAILLPGPAAELEPVLAAFPAQQCVDDPVVAATLAASGIRTGDGCATAVHLDNSERAIASAGAAQRRAVAPWLLALRLMNAGMRDARDRHGLMALCLAAAEQYDEAAATGAERQAIGLLWCAVGVAALADTEIIDAADSFRRARGHLSRGGHRGLLDRATAWQALAAALHGDLRAVDDLAGSQAYTDSAERDLLPALVSWLARALAALGRDDAATARRLLDQCEGVTAHLAEHDSREAGLAPGTGGQVAAWLTGFGRARLALRDGDCATARALVTRLSYDVAGPACLGPALAVLTADIALRDGDAGRARDALRAAGTATAERADIRLGQARTLLATGDSTGALQFAKLCLDGPASQLTLHDQITACIVAAVAHRRLGQSDRAASQLGCALALAEPPGLYRPFLAGGEPVRSVLAGLIRPASPGAAFAARILQRFSGAADTPTSQPTVSMIPLTSSELAVLRFLPSHMTNQEIAEALFLSINTIKTHLRSVYRKLGVSTRRQAIVRADRIGLL